MLTSSTTNDSVRLRWACPDDAALLLEMIRELARFERAEHAVQATEQDLRRDGWGSMPRFEALIAERVRSGDPEPVGFALFFLSYSTWEGQAGVFLEDLYVRPAARGRGIGRRLLAAVAALARNRGYRRLDLAVLHWNPARHFYERLGIRHLDEWLPHRLSGGDLAALAAEGEAL